MNKKILFLVDHKHRDLPGLSLIAYFLNHFGCESKIVALGKYDKIIKSFDPMYIVLPKPNHNFSKLMSWRRDGRKIIIIDAEGNPQDKNFIYKIRVKPDLYIFWNKEIESRYTDLSNKYNTVLKTLGFYRSDFLHYHFHDLMLSREKLLNKYNLNVSGKTITIATATQDSHFSAKRLKLKDRRRKKSLEGTAGYMDIVNNKIELRNKTEKIIGIILKTYPKVNLIIKPHPNENVVYWDELIKKTDSKNIKLFVGEPINNLLRVSDLHISHNVCTTTSEALLFGIPALEVHCDNSKDLFSEKHLYIANYIINKPENINPIIDLVLYGRASNEVQKHKNETSFSDYIEKYLYKYDGLRCFEYAQYLAEFTNLASKNLRSSNFIYDLINTLYYLLIKIRNKLPSYKKHAKIIQGVNNVSIHNYRDVVKVNNKLVDKEYGLFDNRINEGDEEYWYTKFKKNKHIQGLIEK